MAITQKSRWDDTGQEPPTGEARYVAGEQPIAEYDNWFNRAVVDDIAALNQWLDNLGITKVYIDTEANKPASGKTTELFIATDTNKIYRGTGTGWQLLTTEWNAILNKPSTYPPETHQHSDADLLSIDWSKILNKPSVFPPEAHQHDASEIVSGVLSVDRIPSLSRSKISDFFAAPFWDNIPDKPTSFWNHVDAVVHNDVIPTEWTDLDLSGYIGQNRALVLLRLRCMNSSYGETVVFRANDDYDFVRHPSGETAPGVSLAVLGASNGYADESSSAYVLVPTDSYGVIEMKSKYGNRVVKIWLLGYI